MNTKKHVTKQSKTAQQHPTKTFASTKEVHKAADKAMTQYAEAIRRLADR